MLQVPDRPGRSGWPAIGFGSPPHVVPLGRHCEKTQHPPSGQTLAGPQAARLAAPPPSLPPGAPASPPHPLGDVGSSMQPEIQAPTTEMSLADGRCVLVAGGMLLLDMRW